MEVADTARWVAYLRGQEDTLFRDPYAATLPGARGRDLANAMPALPWLRADAFQRELESTNQQGDEAWNWDWKAGGRS